ncbi:hypothetical protein FRB95_002751 [Tulasnella sp. JGI-2019a]|nr:hypothetical protein FRB95_002751 [Tulasnella sp. JGI-2019a]
MTASHPMKKNPAVELMVDSFTKNEIKQGAVAAFEKMRAEQLKDPAQLKQKVKERSNRRKKLGSRCLRRTTSLRSLGQLLVEPS